MQLNKIILLTVALFSNSFAADIQPAGSINYLLKPVGHAQSPLPQKIKLPIFKLSEKAKANLKHKAQSVSHAPTLKTTSTTNTEKQLGMNGVPVLNQGNFGTCVTFADTAAVDAALGKGDYISQLCLLQLGNYASEHAYSASGWDGSFNRHILSRLEDHGFISKATEQTEGCGGLYEYPRDETIPESAISFNEYHQRSENLTKQGIGWSPILDIYKALITMDINTNNVIKDIKKAIDSEQRVTMASLLPATDLGVAGAVGKHHVESDTWVLSTVIERELYLSNSLFFAGHAMVITGYDDQAIAIDDLGREHVGLFTLRNSWGEQMGDQGDFYMSYDYFRVLGVEANQITHDGYYEDEPEEEEEEEEEDN